MQPSHRTAQRLYLVVPSMPSYRSTPADTLAQRVIVPIFKRGVSEAFR